MTAILCTVCNCMHYSSLHLHAKFNYNISSYECSLSKHIQIEQWFIGAKLEPSMDLAFILPLDVYRQIDGKPIIESCTFIEMFLIILMSWIFFRNISHDFRDTSFWSKSFQILYIQIYFTHVGTFVIIDNVLSTDTKLGKSCLSDITYGVLPNVVPLSTAFSKALKEVLAELVRVPV